MEEKQLRIVFLSRYQNKVFRGVESHVEELSERLAKKFTVDVFSGEDADSLRKVLQGHYDIVIPTNGRLQALKMSIGRLLGGYQIIIVGHSGIGRDDVWNLSFTFPDFFIALTDYQLKWAKKWALKTKILKIPNGVDLKKFSPNGRKAVLSVKHPTVLSVGALEWYKYHEVTIKAISKIANVSLVIIGSGPKKEELTKLGENLLGEGRFRILSVNYDQIQDYYRSVDLFSLPSWDRESFGIVYLEAMASNLPVVAPNDPTRKEIIGQGGLTTNTFDIDLFAKTINQALEIKWGNKPRNQALNFSWDKIAKLYEQLFLKIANDKT